MTANTKEEREALAKALRKQMDKLPQRDLIQESDAAQWIGFMVNVMPDEAMWHMIRAGGIGGSEIGGLVRNYLGFRADFEFSAHDWAESKLLRRTPSPSVGVMQRGHFMEPHHAQLFYERFNARRDVEAFNKLSSAQGQRIWMRYSPDEVFMFDEPVEIQTVDGPVVLQGRILGDYKAPTTVDHDARIAFQYTCQLHQGAILCQEQGIELTGTLLSQFDWATFSMKNDYVEINPELCDLIYEAGDHYWDYVMRGEIPDYIVRNRIDLQPEVAEQWHEAAARLGILNAMATAIRKEAEKTRAALLEGLELDKHRFDGQKIEFPDAISISATTKVDEELVREKLGEEITAQLQVKNNKTEYDTAALVRRLKELGEDVKPYRKLTRLDPSLVFDALLEHGFDPEEFVIESPRVTVNRKVSASAQSWCETSFPELELPKTATKIEDEVTRHIQEREQSQQTQRVARPAV